MDKSKILIVEDNIDTVDLLRKRLRADGYDTGEAYDGEEGLKKVIEYEPDLIVLDIMMPKLDGFQVCRRLKEDKITRHIPVIILTAKGDVDSTVKGLDIGGDDYLAKPFDYKELVARIHSLLRKKTEREKRLEDERAAALQQMMDQVAHEIRNPLVSIGGFARRVSDSLSEGDPNKKYLEMITRNVATLEHMIRQLIELKITGISYREPTDINEIILNAIEKFKPVFGDNHIELKTDLMDDPPSISVDREQIKTAIGNLIENSIEAMRNTTRILKIGSRLNEGYVEIEVSDTGIGIPRDKLKNVMEPFFTSKIHGGLGLPFAIKIIEAHRGNISVESELGEGSTFTVRLPVETIGP